LRILIIKTSALGDIIHALPVLSYLQQAAPGARIDWVAEEAFQELLAGNPALERLITVPFKRWKKERTLTVIAEMRAIAASIRREPYDLVFDLQGNLKSGIICGLARSKRKIGYSLKHLQERVNALATTERVSFRESDSHVIQRYLRVASTPFELSPDAREWSSDIYTSPEDDAYAAGVLAASAAEGPVILLHTGTTWRTKLWHDQGWQGLAEGILAHYPSATLLFSWGTLEERQRGERLVATLGNRGRVLEQLTLKRFAAILKRCDLVVGGDTGPVHLAAAVGRATLSFYRATDGSRNGPFGSRHVIVQSPLPCTDCMHKQCERDQACAESITVATMLDGALRQLGGGAGGRTGVAHAT